MSIVKSDDKEIQVDVQRINDNKFLILIKNLSDKKVFFAYTPGTDEKVKDFSYVTDKLEQTGQYNTYFSGSDYAPSLNPINPGNQVSFEFFEIKKGDYRLRLKYLVDEDLVKVVNDSDCILNLSTSDRQKLIDAYTEITTPNVSIVKSIPQN